MPLPSRRASAGAGRTHPLPPPGLDSGEGLAFEPTRLRERWARERREEAESLADLGMPVKRVGARKPRLALVFANLAPGAMQLQMVSVASVLEAMGYEMKELGCKGGPGVGGGVASAEGPDGVQCGREQEGRDNFSGRLLLFWVDYHIN